ncbi:MAG: nucleotidyltransferase domain-containing protein [Chitinispirillales bacterium]|jgi:predicted nucleotidyltransferase|nr:nucleotidyltransferase domain-containing protein [Chitinispirillales bacterium]
MAYGFEKVKDEALMFADDAKRELSAKKVYLYGSYAKGTADDGSDVDICFFFDGIDGKTRVNAIMKLMDLGRKYKAYFEPNAMPTSELYNDNPFIQEILRTGIELL